MAEPKSMSILGIDFVTSMPYEAGHILTEAEAKVLNQTRRENLSNNFRAKVKAHVNGDEDAEYKTVDELIAAFAELDSKYEFTMASAAASVKYTPEEKEARTIARDYIKGELDAAGRKLKDVPSGMTEQEWDDALEAEISRIAALDEVVKLAKDNLKQRAKAKNLNLSSALGREAGAAA